MTKEEAIKVLEPFKACMFDQHGCPISDVAIALDVAIEALQYKKTGHWIIFPPCIEEICMCSNCKTKFKEAYQHRDTCPSCGARMENES